MLKQPSPTLILGFILSAILAGPASSADAPATGTIAGRVFNTRNGEYLEKACITVEGTTLETFTDSGGQFLRTQLPAGPARVRVFFTSLEPLVEAVPVAAGQTLLRDFNLSGSGVAADRGGMIKLSEFIVGASREMDGAAIAINEQRFAPNITHVVSAGAFGISADGSVGEFLPGISVNYVGSTANTISMDGGSIRTGSVPNGA